MNFVTHLTGAKLEHMLALRDEVEQEYADRMDELRNMYRLEMDAQSEKFEQEKSKMTNLESSLQETLKVRLLSLVDSENVGLNLEGTRFR